MPLKQCHPSDSCVSPCLQLLQYNRYEFQCFLSDMLPHKSHIQWFQAFEVFFFTARDTVCMLKQWRHGAMVGWGNGWLNCIVIYMQKWTLSVCITAQNPLMMACIYTNTQTYTYAVHTEDLFTCTYTPIYAFPWIRYGSDPSTVTNRWDLEAKWVLGGPKNKSMIHHQLGTLIKLVGLWKRSALFLSFILAGMIISFFCLSMVLLFAMWQTFALYISLFRASHYSSKQLVFFFLSFLWSDAFYQSNRLAAVFEWPGPHTHTPHKLYRPKINA